MTAEDGDLRSEDLVEDKPWTRVAAHGLCASDGKILLVRLAPHVFDAGAWGLPGGGLDWGERPEDAVVREFREETGLEVVVEDLAGIYSDTFLRSDERPFDSVHFMSVLFWVRTTGQEREAGAIAHELDGTTDLAAWVPLTETGALPLAPLAVHGLALLAGRPHDS